jgi:hypothetical protein
MLAYHVEHARGSPRGAAAKRASIVAKAERSDAANRKPTTERAADGLPAHKPPRRARHLLPHPGHHEEYPFTLHTGPPRSSNAPSNFSVSTQIVRVTVPALAQTNASSVGYRFRKKEVRFR